VDGTPTNGDGSEDDDDLVDPTAVTTLDARPLRDLPGRSYDLGPGATGGGSGDGSGDGSGGDPVALGKVEFDENEGGVLELSLDGTGQSWAGSDREFVRVSDLTADDVAGGVPVAAGEQVRFVTEWRLPSSVGNEVQTDTVEVGFRLGLRTR
jgi:hypothetical protein